MIYVWLVLLSMAVGFLLFELRLIRKDIRMLEQYAANDYIKLERLGQ